RPVVDIAGRIAGNELQSVERHTTTGGHGVCPGDVAVEADGHAGASEQAHAIDIEIARHREVLLPEALRARPEPVWVGEKHAAPALRARGADRPRVTGGQGPLRAR